LGKTSPWALREGKGWTKKSVENRTVKNIICPQTNDRKGSINHLTVEGGPRGKLMERTPARNHQMVEEKTYDGLFG